MRDCLNDTRAGSPAALGYLLQVRRGYFGQQALAKACLLLAADNQLFAQEVAYVLSANVLQAQGHLTRSSKNAQNTAEYNVAPPKASEMETLGRILTSWTPWLGG